jgi:hypothetical protein
MDLIIFVLIITAAPRVREWGLSRGDGGKPTPGVEGTQVEGVVGSAMGDGGAAGAMGGRRVGLEGRSCGGGRGEAGTKSELGGGDGG